MPIFLSLECVNLTLVSRRASRWQHLFDVNVFLFLVTSAVTSAVTGISVLDHYIPGGILCSPEDFSGVGGGNPSSKRKWPNVNAVHSKMIYEKSEGIKISNNIWIIMSSWSITRNDIIKYGLVNKNYNVTPFVLLNVIQYIFQHLLGRIQKHSAWNFSKYYLWIAVTDTSEDAQKYIQKYLGNLL